MSFQNCMASVELKRFFGEPFLSAMKVSGVQNNRSSAEVIQVWIQNEGAHNTLVELVG